MLVLDETEQHHSRKAPNRQTKSQPPSGNLRILRTSLIERGLLILDWNKRGLSRGTLDLSVVLSGQVTWTEAVQSNCRLYKHAFAARPASS